MLWGRWGWAGCVVLIIGFQLLSLLIAQVGWKKPSASLPTAT